MTVTASPMLVRINRKHDKEVESIFGQLTGHVWDKTYVGPDARISGDENAAPNATGAASKGSDGTAPSSSSSNRSRDLPPLNRDSDSANSTSSQNPRWSGRHGLPTQMEKRESRDRETLKMQQVKIKRLSRDALSLDVRAPCEDDQLTEMVSPTTANRRAAERAALVISQRCFDSMADGRTKGIGAVWLVQPNQFLPSSLAKKAAASSCALLSRSIAAPNGSQPRLAHQLMEGGQLHSAHHHHHHQLAEAASRHGVSTVVDASTIRDEVSGTHGSLSERVGGKYSRGERPIPMYGIVNNRPHIAPPASHVPQSLPRLHLVSNNRHLHREDGEPVHSGAGPPPPPSMSAAMMKDTAPMRRQGSGFTTSRGVSELRRGVELVRLKRNEHARMVHASRLARHQQSAVGPDSHHAEGMGGKQVDDLLGFVRISPAQSSPVAIAPTTRRVSSRMLP